MISGLGLVQQPGSRTEPAVMVGLLVAAYLVLSMPCNMLAVQYGLCSMGCRRFTAHKSLRSEPAQGRHRQHQTSSVA